MGMYNVIFRTRYEIHV